MRQVIKDVIGYVMMGQQSSSLQSACAEWGQRDVRLFCVSLSSWWARRTLMQSRHPNLSLSACPWHPQFRAFVESIPELRDLIRFDDDACHFSDSVTASERRAINDYAQEHYRPPVFTRSQREDVDVNHGHAAQPYATNDKSVAAAVPAAEIGALIGTNTHLETRPWRACPFTPGRAYRVRQNFAALRDSFTAGDVLTFDSDAWSRYDGITGYFFRQAGRDRLRVWDIDDEAEIRIWQELFEELPDAVASHDD